MKEFLTPRKQMKTLMLIGLLLAASDLAAQGIYPSAPQSKPPDHKWLGVMGDSGTTGAASDKDRHPSLANILELVAGFAMIPQVSDIQPPLQGHPLEGKVQSFQRPFRIFYSAAEEKAAEKAKTLEVLKAGMKVGLRIDLEENSFGYQYGTLKAYPPQDIVFVGQNGARVDAIPEQLERLFDFKSPTLPPVVLVSFTANDFCDKNVFTDGISKRREAFAKALSQAWTQSEKFLKPHPEGTHFIVLSPLEVANVLTSPGVLQQKIGFEGNGGMTCGKLRAADFAKKRNDLPTSGSLLEQVQSFAQKPQLEAQIRVQQALVSLCESVLSTRPDDHQRLQFLQQIQKEFRQVWREQISALNQTYQARGLKWSFVEGTSEIGFAEGDVANDCFHPSARGHQKITEILLAH